MTQTMDLNKMGLAPMSELEMDQIDGGRLGLMELALTGIGLVINAAYEMGKKDGARITSWF